MDFGVGPGCAPGTLWMTSTDGNWYAVNITGSSGSAQLYVSQSPLNYQDNSLGYQLLKAPDNNVYQIYLTGNSGSVSVNISQSAWGNPNDYKPYLFLSSITDGLFYVVGAITSSGHISMSINPNGQSVSIFI